MTKSGLLLCLFIASVTYGECAVCEYQYNNRLCYELSTDQVTNKYAKDVCEGGKLARANDVVVVDYLANMLKDKNVSVAWVDGSPIFTGDSPIGKCAYKLDKYGGSGFKLSTLGCPDDEKLFSICEFYAQEGPWRKCKVHDSLVRNGFLTPCIPEKSVSAGTKLRVGCWTGYALRGPKEITCQDNGEWTKTPICEPICLEKLLHGNGITVYPLSQNTTTPKKLKHYKLHESAVIICENGILANSTTAVTHKVVTCLGSNKWSEISPYCIPFDQISFLHPRRAKHVIETPIHSPLAIDCLSEDGDSVTKVWTKDQQPLPPSDEYFVNEFGTLSFKNFTLGDEGLYLCSIKTHSSSFEFVSYDLRLENKQTWFSSEPLEVIRMKEGESRMFSCKDSNYLYLQKWYKNAIPYFGTDLGSSVTDDGALYLSNVSPLDNGLYLCVVENLAEGRYTGMTVTSYQIMVTPDRRAACGRLLHYTDNTGVDLKDETDVERNSKASYFEEHVPWFVSFIRGYVGTPFCYGTLIDKDLIITSAQCFNGRRRLMELVRVGFNRVDKREEDPIFIRINKKIQIHFVHPQNFTFPKIILGKQIHFYIPYEMQREDVSISTYLLVDPEEKDLIKIKDIIIHPDYDGDHTNDLALIRLQQEVPVTDFIRPICLPHVLNFTEDEKCKEARITNGFVITRGVIDSGRDGKTRGKDVEIHRREKCEELFRKQLPLNILCVEDTENYEDKPKEFVGDLGSPLEVKWMNRYTLWGVHSGTPDRYFEFYTQILPYMDWINSYLH